MDCTPLSGWGGGSEDGLGVIEIVLTPPSDDRTASADLGYRVRLVEGSLPDDLLQDPFEGVWKPGPEGFYLDWDDDASDRQEPVSFALEIAAVDKAGNEGPATQVVYVNAGNMGGACALLTSRPSSAALPRLLALGLLFAARRSRCPGPCPEMPRSSRGMT